METVLAHHAEKTYASKIKKEVDEHLTGMDCQISRVNEKIDEVRRKSIIEQDRKPYASVDGRPGRVLGIRGHQGRNL